MIDVNLWEYLDKNVKVTLDNGKVFTGTVIDYACELENEFIEHRPPAASIALGMFELYEDEIASIEILSQPEKIAHAEIA
jgi:hypothetical protein